jgi:hypothetical protein
VDQGSGNTVDSAIYFAIPLTFVGAVILAMVMRYYFTKGGSAETATERPETEVFQVNKEIIPECDDVEWRPYLGLSPHHALIHPSELKMAV